MVESAKKRVVQRFIEGYLNGRDDAVGHETIAPDIKVHLAPFDGREAYMAQHKAVGDAMPDARWNVVHILEDGDLVAVFASFDGTLEGPFGDLPATGRQAKSVPVAGFMRVEDGKIQEIWSFFDRAGFAEQVRPYEE